MSKAFAPAPMAQARADEVERVLPYARHVTEEIVSLDSGALLTVFQLDGASFETADAETLNDWHEKLNGVWRTLAGERLALWHHLIRKPCADYAPGAFASAFAERLDRAYGARLQRTQMFETALYLTLVMHPKAGVLGRLDRARPEASDLAQAIKRLEDAARDLAQGLGRYGPRRLTVRQTGGLWISEPMSLFHQLLTGREGAFPLVRGHLGAALYDTRLIFGREALEIRDLAESRFAGLLGVKEYPPATRPGLWNSLMSAPFPLVVSQSFAFLSKTAARTVLERKQNQMLSAQDRATSQVDALDDALDALISNRFVMGEHQASVMVYGQTLTELAERLAQTRALLSDAGLVAAREDLALEAAFWAQFPGGFRFRARPAAITSRNFASFAPFHTHPVGRADGVHWGQAVALLRTTAGSPYHFNFHLGDVGHSFICGPSGAGKTVWQNFLLAQLEKLQTTQVLVDKDRGSEIFVRARGGTYLTFRPGQPMGLAPFKALDFTPAHRRFLAQLVRRLAGPQALSAREADAIDAGLAALAPLPRAQRSLGALRTLLGQADAEGLGARLSRWTAGGPMGWALDNREDDLALEDRLMGFDITHLLDDPELRTPILMYLFHRLQGPADGRRLVIDIDEFWKALGDEAFRGLAQDGLKTFRKQNAIMVLATQSPADVLASPIAHTLLEQCVTKIFLPNPQAQARDYCDGFGLSPREFQWVRQDLSGARRQALIKQGLHSVAVELRLDGLDDEIAILSGRTETVDLLERLRAEVGDDYHQWAGPFQAARRGLA
ncbi:VirB4 family type IV secretion/conjugal transfer ATPase [Phenylobacterium aquaticum]|uniref:VirB4 family type IV secretion/conjugal transfer ATPase n=1 Tax=Phenylobacterium aquaticum TaxID=1763816 RepID=UPI001F5D116E|nr:VirB4 family type IV secretion/conjugal transfer ATPase [Phenylobacterium aquaticum]MCI3135346.1 VirB4 family type IV secretion/conjugal transfer ATPase [Phenylobacterium aquaticum]